MPTLVFSGSISRFPEKKGKNAPRGLELRRAPARIAIDGRTWGSVSAGAYQARRIGPGLERTRVSVSSVLAFPYLGVRGRPSLSGNLL